MKDAAMVIKWKADGSYTPAAGHEPAGVLRPGRRRGRGADLVAVHEHRYLERVSRTRSMKRRLPTAPLAKRH